MDNSSSKLRRLFACLRKSVKNHHIPGCSIRSRPQKPLPSDKTANMPPDSLLPLRPKAGLPSSHRHIMTSLHNNFPSVRAEGLRLRF